MRSALSALVVGVVVLSTVAAVPTAGAASLSDDVTTNQSPSTAGAASTATTVSDHDACAPVANGTAPANPDGDPLGWENGCWYNESLSVTTGDGLNQTELDALVGRSMARVETIRQLEFNKTVPVEILPTEEYRAEITNFSSNTTTADRLHQNAKFEALFVLNESEDAISAQKSSLANGTLGFYDPQRERIRIVSSDPSSVTLSERTLGHELVHALQDQQFNTTYNRSTTDGVHGSDGIVEGDADFVESNYTDRCGAEWQCAMPTSMGGGSGSVNVGLQVNQLVPYSEGSEFVQTRYRQGGWEAVNAVYENPPTHAEQVIHPEKYPAETPERLRINHSASDGWRVLELPGGINHATFGEGSIYTMMWYASYQKSVQSGSAATVAVPYAHLFDFPLGTSPPGVGPYNYSHPVTDGWDGDRLVPYVTNESADTGELGYVWKLDWDTEADAEQFHEAYLRLIEYRGAEAVDGYQNTYRIPDDERQGFGDAFYVTRNSDQVVVVNAPTVADLDSVRAGAAPEAASTPTATATATETDGEMATATATATATPTETEMATDTPTEAEMTEEPATAAEGTESPAATTSSGGPGFGVAVALVALLVGALAARRRE